MNVSTGRADDRDWPMDRRYRIRCPIVSLTDAGEKKLYCVVCAIFVFVAVVVGLCMLLCYANVDFHQSMGTT